MTVNRALVLMLLHGLEGRALNKVERTGHIMYDCGAERLRNMEGRETEAKSIPLEATN